MEFQSLLIHGGIDGDEETGAVNVPLHLSSTFKQTELGIHKGYEYARTGNPTRNALEQLIAELELGYKGYAFASGMAATSAVLMLFKSHDKILLSNNVYGGTYRILDKVFNHFNLEYELVDTSNLALVASKISPQVKAIFIETPTNPLMTITDIAQITALAKKNNLLTIVDNTFMTPYLQQPIALGADIVIHSATKYLGGHSDLVAGLVVVNTPKLAEQIHFIQNSSGGILSPFDSWLLIRGIKTLAVRMDRHLENAAYLVDYLLGHPAVIKVYYPGLKQHDGYTIQQQQAKGAGGIISFVLSDKYNLKQFYKELQLITLGESLGGVESLISHPTTMTHAAIPKTIREELGIVDNLIRLSAGIESKTDLVADLEQALTKARI